MTVSPAELKKGPIISEIEDLRELKQYACQRYRFKNEWYLMCVDCKSLKNCAAGKQAVKLMEESTAAKNTVPDPKKDLRAYINYVFRQKDPIKFLLESAGSIRPQSLYNRVYLWKKNFPDLEEKYHMLDRTRFLWSKPYSTMKIEDVLKKMYPEEGPAADFGGKYAAYSVVDPEKSETKKEEKIMAKETPETGEIALDDFLMQHTKNGGIVKVDLDQRTATAVPPKANPVPAVPEKKQADEKSTGTDKKSGAVSAGGSDSARLDSMLQKLRNDISEYEQKISQAKEKISAILTVQEMMRFGV